MIAFRHDILELRFLARRRLIRRLKEIADRERNPLRLVRPFMITQRISGATRVMPPGSTLADRRKRPVDVPFGWMVLASEGAYRWEVGPIWYLGGRWLFYEARHRFYHVMLYKLEWATLAQEGGYYRDVKWKWLEYVRGRQSWK